MTRSGMTRLAVAVAASVGLSGLVAAARSGSRYSAALAPEQEVPAVSSGASGRITLDIDEDGQEIAYELSFSGLQGDVRQSHIHFGQAGVNGGIVLWLCDSATNNSPVATTPLCPQSGSVSGVLVPSDVQGSAANTQQINAGEFAEAVAFIRKGLAYANVHTSLSPGGEIRGQIRAGGGHQ
jgi:CHRD domain